MSVGKAAKAKSKKPKAMIQNFAFNPSLERKDRLKVD